MTLADLLATTLAEMDHALDQLSSVVPKPKVVPIKHGFVFRHVEQLAGQAILQKLARIPAGLRAAQLLCDHGYFQEQGVLQRVIDELGEDVIFLAIPLISGVEEQIHRDYLNSFFAEDFDLATGTPLPQQRHMIPRKKIRAYIANSPYGSQDPSGHIETGRTLSKTYSGFVHAASPHIMDTYGGDPPHFHTSGMLGTVRETEYRSDLLNYYYRGLSAFVIAASALGDQPLFARLYRLSKAYSGLDIGI